MYTGAALALKQLTVYFSFFVQFLTKYTIFHTGIYKGFGTFFKVFPAERSLDVTCSLQLRLSSIKKGRFQANVHPEAELKKGTSRDS